MVEFSSSFYYGDDDDDDNSNNWILGGLVGFFESFSLVNFYCQHISVVDSFSPVV